MIDDFTCNYGRFHNYSETIGENDYVLVQICVWCGRRIRFNKSEGVIDQRRYQEAHRLDYLQEAERDYSRYYSGERAKNRNDLKSHKLK